MSTRWHMMSEKQLSILIQGRNHARGNRQIIRILRAFACKSAGAPWLWRSVMQIDKVSQEPARLGMLTAPFHGTFFSIGSSQCGGRWLAQTNYDALMTHHTTENCLLATQICLFNLRLLQPFDTPYWNLDTCIFVARAMSLFQHTVVSVTVWAVLPQ